MYVCAPDCDNMRLPSPYLALAKLLAGVALDYLDRPQEALMLLQEAVTIWKTPRPWANVSSSADAAKRANVSSSADAAKRANVSSIADTARRTDASSGTDAAKRANVSSSADTARRADASDDGPQESACGGMDAASLRDVEDLTMQDSSLLWDEDNIPAFASYEIGFILSRYPEVSAGNLRV